MPRYGRMVPCFGTLQSFKADGISYGAMVLEKMRFAGTADRIVNSMTGDLIASLVTEQECKDLYDTLFVPTALVWKPMCGVGHAAVFIGPGTGPTRFRDTERYAGLFPGADVKPDTGKSGAGPEHMLPGRKLEGSAHSFLGDCQSEGNGKGTYRLPEFVIPMPRLNSLAMLSEWISVRDKVDMHYRLMRKNCSTIAARVIRAGVPRGSASLVAHKAWWTPYDVVTLARAVA